MATKYRCYLIEADRIAAINVIECESQADAVLEADRLLAASPCTSAEIWDRGLQVSIINRSPSAA